MAIGLKSINLHAMQGKAIFSPKRIKFCISGIQGGKSLVGALWLRLTTALYKDKDDCFLVCVPTYKTWNQATSFHFNRMFNGVGTHNKQDGTFTLSKTGQKIYIRSLDNVWSIEGITNCRAIWCDEVGQFRYQAWVNVMGRAAFKEADIFNSTTPYTLNWLYHDIYRPWTEGKLKDVDIFQWRSIDNPYFPKDEYERQKAMLDARIFAMKYEGTFQKMAGLVYEDFDRVENGYDIFDWKARKDLFYVYAGVDWGYSNPFAIVVRVVRKDGQGDYQIDEFMRSYMTPDECVRVGKDFAQKYGIEMFYCDEEAPDYIAAFNKAGLKASPVKKGPGSVMAGIGLHQSLIKTRHHRVFKGMCPQTVDEYETYAFPEREGRAENQSENPIDANNHLMSATRYVTMATQWIRDKARQEAKFKPQLQNDHIAKLLKRHSQVTSWEYV
jgi:PBSX family phage terminase large subunit